MYTIYFSSQYIHSPDSYLAHDLNSLPPGSFEPAIDIDQQTDSNHDTALTLAAAGKPGDAAILQELFIFQKSY